MVTPKLPVGREIASRRPPAKLVVGRLLKGPHPSPPEGWESIELKINYTTHYVLGTYVDLPTKLYPLLVHCVNQCCFSYGTHLADLVDYAGRLEQLGLTCETQYSYLSSTVMPLDFIKENLTIFDDVPPIKKQLETIVEKPETVMRGPEINYGQKAAEHRLWGMWVVTDCSS